MGNCSTSALEFEFRDVCEAVADLRFLLRTRWGAIVCFTKLNKCCALTPVIFLKATVCSICWNIHAPIHPNTLYRTCYNLTTTFFEPNDLSVNKWPKMGGLSIFLALSHVLSKGLVTPLFSRLQTNSLTVECQLLAE